MQDIVLGLLRGAIMGLFVGYIGKATPDLGLGLSALALLAGYNVSGVFAVGSSGRRKLPSETTAHRLSCHSSGLAMNS